jgi:hypothetical protein
MNLADFAKGQVLFREGDPADSVFRLLTTADRQTAGESYLAAKNPWLERQLPAPLGLGDLPFVVGRGPVAREGLPPLQPDLKLDDAVPFRLSRNHFMIEKRHGNYYVRDLRSTLGTIVNGEPIGDHFRGDDALLRAGENEVIAISYQYDDGSSGNLSKSIDEEIQLTRFWVIVRDSEQAVGWGCVKS